ncbi:MAG TPA: hypothetical protein VN247_01925 [Arenimonas sp.]|nr:hypothetical protein [Arenimonas sp.]
MRIVSLLLLATALTLSSAATAKSKGTKLLSSWSDPSVPIISGKKVLVVFIDSDLEKRKAVETEMAKYIKNSVLGYTLLADRSMLENNEATRFQLKRHAIDYIVALHFDGTVPQFDAKTTNVYKDQADFGSVAGMYGYWDNGWKSAYQQQSITKNNKTIVQIETKVFDVPTEKMIWTSKSQTMNPQNADEAVGGVIKANADAMRKDGLIK